MTAKRPQMFFALVVALAAVSTAAPILKAAGAPALTASLWRTALGAIALVLICLWRRPPRLPRTVTPHVLGAGVALALHFALWIASLSYTTVAASVVLVCTQPLFVALIDRVVRGTPIARRALLGIVVAVSGAAVIALVSLGGSGGSDPLRGGALALGGALAVAIYVLVSSSARARGADVLPYSAAVYATSALTLAVACGLTDAPIVDVSQRTAGWLLALAIGPQIIGHTLLLWALAYLPATVLSTTILAEPVVAAALTAIFLAEIPDGGTVFGGTVILSGIWLVVTTRRG